MSENQTHPEHAPDDTPPRRKRRWLRWTLAGGALLLIALLLLGAFAPAILSTPAGTRWLAARINAAIPGTLTMDAAELSWSGQQRIEQLRILDPQGQLVIEAPQVVAQELSLWSLIRGGHDYGQITLTQPRFVVEQQEDGATNLDRALGLDEPAPTEDADEPVSLPPDTALALQIEDGSGTYSAPGIAPVEVSQLSATLTAPNPQQISATLRGLLRQEALTGSIEADGRVSDLFGPDGRLQVAAANVALDANMNNLPMPAVDRLAEADGLLVALLGQALSAQVNVNGPVAQVQADIDAQSDRAQLTAQLIGDGQAVRATQTSFQVTITPDAWDRLSQRIDALADTRLQESFPLRVLADELVIPLGEEQAQLAQAQISARAEALAPIRLVAEAPLGELVVSNLTAEALTEQLGERLMTELSAEYATDGQAGSLALTASLDQPINEAGQISFTHAGFAADVNLTAEDLPVPLIDRFAQLDGLATQLAGQAATVTASANLTPMQEADGQAAPLPLVGPFSLLVQAEQAQLSLTGALAPEALTLTQPGQAQLRLEPADLAMLEERFGEALPEALQGLQLQAPAAAELRITALRLPWAAGDEQLIAMEQASVGLSAAVDQLALALPQVNQGVDLRNLRLNWQEAALSAPTQIELTADVADQAQPGSLAVAGTLDAPLAESPTFDGTVRAQALPVALLDSLADQDGQLVTMLGERIEELALEVTTPAAEDAPMRIEGRVATTLARVNPLQAQLRLAPFSAAITDSQINYTLTPGMVDYLLGPAPDEQPAAQAPSPPAQLRLAEPTGVQVAIQNAQLSSGADGALDLQNAAANLRIAAQPITLIQVGAPAVRIGDLSANLTTENLARRVRLQATASVQREAEPNQPAPEPAAVESDTTLTNLVNAQGEFDLASASLVTETRAPSFPMPLVDALLDTDGRVTGTVGQQANVTLVGQAPGELSLAFTGQTARADLPLLVGEDRVLRLAQDATVQLQITPDVAQSLLKWANPVLIDAQASDEPLTLRIFADGFALPIDDFDMARVAGNFRLEPGQLVLQDSWLLSAIAPGLAQLGLPLGGVDDRQTVRFTGLSAALQEGRVVTNDMWLFSPRLLLGTRAQVDLSQNRANVAVAISSQMLGQIDWLEDVVEPGAVYELRAQGNLDNLQPDFRDFFVQVLSLRARAELSREAGEFGGLVDLAVGQVAQGLTDYRAEQPWPNQPQVNLEELDQPAAPPAEGQPGAPAEAPQQQEQAEPEEPADPLQILFGELQRRRQEREAEEAQRRERREQQQPAE